MPSSGRAPFGRCRLLGSCLGRRELAVHIHTLTRFMGAFCSELEKYAVPSVTPVQFPCEQGLDDSPAESSSFRSLSSFPRTKRTKRPDMEPLDCSASACGGARVKMLDRYNLLWILSVCFVTLLFCNELFVVPNLSLRHVMFSHFVLYFRSDMQLES